MSRKRLPLMLADVRRAWRIIGRERHEEYRLDIQLPHAKIVRDVGFLIRKVGRRQPAVA